MNKRSYQSARPKFPVSGSLAVMDYRKYLNESKVKFEEKWTHPVTFEYKLLDFQLLKIVGAGSFGTVVLASHQEGQSGCQHLYAMKAIEKEVIVKAKIVRFIQREKKMLECIDCPVTVSMDFFFQDNCYLYFGMPYISGVRLSTLVKESGKLDEEQTKFIIGQVVLALEYLNYLDILHRDIKPENIIVDFMGYLKLVDFGFSIRMDQKKRTFSFCGTPDYLAPEMITGSGYGKTIDWWGLGVLSYEVAVGITPFYSRKLKETYTKITTESYICPNCLSKELTDFIKNLLKVNLWQRFGNLRNGVNDIKNHVWFDTVDWMALLNRKAAAPVTLIERVNKFNTVDEPTPVTLKSLTKDQYYNQFKDF